ncbi:MAG: hypothetical protein ACF8LL_05025 [Phycisphaerales bacterium]
MDLTQLLGTVIAAGVGTLLAAGLGYRYALARFRRERAFDRRLEWYEGAVRILVGAANSINWALAGKQIDVPEDEIRKAWSAAYEELLKLRGLEIEAQLYATRAGHRAVEDVVETVTTLAKAMMYVGERSDDKWSVPSRLFEIEYKLLLHAAATLASDVREHLGLEEVERDWSIFDRELTQLAEELQELQEKVQEGDGERPYGGLVPRVHDPAGPPGAESGGGVESGS